MATTSIDSVTVTDMSEVSDQFLSILLALSVHCRSRIDIVVWSYRTARNEGEPTALSVFGVTSRSTPAGNLTVC